LGGDDDISTVAPNTNYNVLDSLLNDTGALNQGFYEGKGGNSKTPYPNLREDGR